MNSALQLFLNLSAVAGGVLLIGLSLVFVACTWLFIVGASKGRGE